MHVLVAIATVEVCVAVVVHAAYATVFLWYFVLVAVFAAYAFRRRAEAIAQLVFAVAGMVITSVHARALDPDAIANAIVAHPDRLRGRRRRHLAAGEPRTPRAHRRR